MGLPPNGWPSKVSWSNFKGPHHKLSTRDAEEILFSFLTVQDIDPHEYGPENETIKKPQKEIPKSSDTNDIESTQEEENEANKTTEIIEKPQKDNVEKEISKSSDTNEIESFQEELSNAICDLSTASVSSVGTDLSKKSVSVSTISKETYPEGEGSEEEGGGGGGEAEQEAARHVHSSDRQENNCNINKSLRTKNMLFCEICGGKFVGQRSLLEHYKFDCRR